MFESKETLLKGLPDDLHSKPKIFSNNNIAIMKPNHFIVNEECCFEQYHFSALSVETPPINIGKKQYIFKPNRLLALNPEQPIMVTHDAPTIEYTALFVNKRFFQEIAYAICGKTEVQFENDCNIISKRLRDIFECFVDEFISMTQASTLMLDCISSQIAIQLFREIKSNISDRMQDKRYADKSYAKKAIDFINEYYNSDITLDDLCKKTNLSPYHFIRVFKSETGKTPHEYILDIKIQKAMELIRKNQYSFNEIAQICGFLNQSHFSMVFKKRVGVNPSVYKKDSNQLYTIGVDQS